MNGRNPLLAFLTYDILDTQKGTYVDAYGHETQGTWLSTPARLNLLKGLPAFPVHIVHEGTVDSVEHLSSMLLKSVGASSDILSSVRRVCEEGGHELERILKESDTSGTAEGLYLKVEDGDRTIGRYKFVRPGFLQSIMFSGSHHQDRPIFPNQLAPGVDIFRRGQ